MSCRPHGFALNWSTGVGLFQHSPFSPSFPPALKEAKVSVQGDQLTGTLKLSEQSLAELVKTLIR